MGGGRNGIDDLIIKWTMNRCGSIGWKRRGGRVKWGEGGDPPWG